MRLLSVSEYAEKHGKDTGTIRKLISEGRIPAQKVGKQWAIPAETPFPADARVKSGKYRDWRRKADQETPEE